MGKSDRENKEQVFRKIYDTIRGIMMSRIVDDSEELCPEGETLWNNHLKKVDSITTEMSGYHTYLKHIWACKECQKGLGLSRKMIEIQKAHYHGEEL